MKTALFALALIAAQAHAETGPTIAVEKFAFAPKEITVTPGTTVTWTNKDETPHTVSASDKSYVSKAMDTQDTFTHTFVSEGDFSYFCTLHPFMTGTVHVHAKK